MTPEQRAQFISNIVDADNRRDAEAFWRASHVAGQAYAQACVAKGIFEMLPTANTSTLEEREAALSALVAADSELVELRDAADLALANWVACAGYGEPLETDDGEIIRCALTGFIVHENDRYLLDIRTHECVLKAVLGLPLGYFVGEFTSAEDGFNEVEELPIAEAVS